VNKRGDTPLHFAVFHQDVDMVDFLIQNGADIHAKNELGYSPLEIATLYNSKVILRHLRQKSLDSMNGSKKRGVQVQSQAKFSMSQSLN